MFLKFCYRIFEWYEIIGIIYLDFSKALDKVPYKRLIKKLKGYGFRENVLRWIAKWLEDRKQRVQLNGQRLEMMYHKGLF